jgi:hypothetical protein
MGNNIAFQAQGKTYKANVTTSSQVITVVADSPCNQICVANHQPTGGTGQPVYFAVSNLANVTVTAPAMVALNTLWCLCLARSRFTPSRISSALALICTSPLLVKVRLSATLLLARAYNVRSIPFGRSR